MVGAAAINTSLTFVRDWSGGEWNVLDRGSIVAGRSSEGEGSGRGGGVAEDGARARPAQVARANRPPTGGRRRRQLAASPVE